MIDEMQDISILWAWFANIIGLILAFVTRWFANKKGTWAVVGVILLVIALGNATLLVASGLEPARHLASLFGVVVLGSLGARFLGNWFTDGAT